MACSCLRQVATSSLASRTLTVAADPRRPCPVGRVKIQLTNDLFGPALTLTARKGRSITRAPNNLTAVAQAVTTPAETEAEADVVTEETSLDEEIAAEEVQQPEAVRAPRVKKTRGLNHIMEELQRRAIAEASEGKTLPDLRTGDIVQLRVEVPENKKRVSLLRGIVIAKHNAGLSTTFRIRRVIAGVGVEMVFPLYSPNIKEIKVINSRKVRRAKLYYLRHKLARLSTV